MRGYGSVLTRGLLRLFLLSAILLLVHDVRAQQLTLASAVQLALTRNERSRIAELNVESAGAAVAKARAAFLPSLTLVGTETLRPYQVELANKVVGRTNAANGTFTLSQPLFAATAFPLYSGAKHSSRSSAFHRSQPTTPTLFRCGALVFRGHCATATFCGGPQSIGSRQRYFGRHAGSRPGRPSQH